jgi:hypothetical protein
MKLVDISQESVKPLSNREISSIHRRIHQLYVLAIQRKNNEKYVKLLVKTHRIIANEMKRRNLQHKTPIENPTLEMFLQNIQ